MHRSNFLTLLLLMSAALPAAASITQFSDLIYFGSGYSSVPYTGLTPDGFGNFYGTTTGGTGGNGSVFKLTPSGSGWMISTLYEFSGGPDGANPRSPLLIGTDGSLYGSTFAGGGAGCGIAGCGTVYKLTNQGGRWMESVLYRFSGSPDGTNPSGTLLIDSSGTILGTTQAGGLLNGCNGQGCGTAFKLTQSGGNWSESLIYTFNGSNDGALPTSGLSKDASSNLYGVTSMGGASTFGTVFELQPSGSGWVKSTVYTFNGQNDGKYPQAGLLVNASGSLFGSTSYGTGINLGGTVFQLTPSSGSWAFSLLYTFTGNGGPVAPLISDALGNFYGTTLQDGRQLNGSVFILTPTGSGWTYTALHDFTGTDGAQPMGSVVFDSSGTLYGTTSGGGNSNNGVIFSIAFASPTVSSLNPAGVLSGVGSFNIVVSGSNFVDGSQVLWNGQPLSTTYSGENALMALVPSNLVALPGKAFISVYNPPPGPATSNRLPFLIGGGPPVANTLNYGQFR